MNVLLVALDDLPPATVPDGTVLVVVPALNSRLRHWLSDDDDARRRAEERLAAVLDRIAQDGVRAEGRVGDADPLLAIADALVMFRADAIVIAAGLEGSTQLADELVPRAHDRFALPTSRSGQALPKAA